MLAPSSIPASIDCLLGIPECLQLSLSSKYISSLKFEPHPICDKAWADIVMIPPVVGLYPPLDESFLFIAETLADQGFCTTVMSFAGQYGRKGAFSVAGACLETHRILANANRPVLLFGICTGALTALAGSIENNKIGGLFCWDMTANFDYSQDNIAYFTNRYGMSFCETLGYFPVQAHQLIPFVTAPITFAYPKRSYYTTAKAQQALAKLANVGKCICLEQLGHFPGVPFGSEKVFAEILYYWATTSRYEK